MAIAAGVLATLALTVANTVTAHDDGGRGGCNAASLRGDYGLLFSGVAVEDPQLPAGMTVGTGVRTYHGNGTFDQIDNEHFQFFGEPIHNRRATGTYTVNADCTGSAVLNLGPGIMSTFVIVDSGNRVKEAVMFPPPALVTAVQERIR
jgi:hypothetical protein